MKTTVTVLASVLAAATFATEAQARDVAVSTRGVDFGDAQSVDAFHRTLARAAEDACTTPGRRDLTLRRVEDQCRAEALADAVAELDRPVLTALNEALDARLRLRPARPALDGAALAAAESAARPLRAEIAGETALR